MSQNIKIGAIRHHTKASETYINVTFSYPNITLDWDIPIQYRRTGTDLRDKSSNEIAEYIEKIYMICNPLNWDAWKKEQIIFWSSKNAATTKPFFDVLVNNFKWISQLSDLPQNPNWARRIQDIKENGYTLATNTNMADKKKSVNCTHILLLPIPRGGVTGYETWSKEERENIINVLESRDAFEDKVMKKEGLLPDHKFPEIRWDENTKRDSLSDLSNDDIKNDFQLLNNQRNQQKREVCRNCYQTGKRGIAFGINYFYKGSEFWDKQIPQKGKVSEKGCIGCAWYDFKAWRESLNSKIKN